MDGPRDGFATDSPQDGFATDGPREESAAGAPHDDPHRTPDSTGFDLTRRTVLKTGSALGLAAAAGCNEVPDTPTPTLDPTTDFVDDGLEIIDAGFVAADDGWTDLRDGGGGGQSPTAGGDRDYLRVLVRNTLSTPISVVTVSVEVFDGDLDFLGVQSATISSLLSQEVFAGYLPYLYDDAAAYVLRAERSGRPDGNQSLNSVSLAGHCVINQQVRGTVNNVSPTPVGRFRVLVRFYDADGNVLGTGTDTITGIEAHWHADFAVDANAVVGDSAATVADYSITVGDYDGEVFAVR